MKIEDLFEITGILSIWKVFPDGKRELTFEEENLITLLTKQQILSYIYSAITTDPVNGIKVGIGGTIDPDGLFPKQENQNWTTLNNTITSIGTGGLLSVGQAVDSSVPKVTFLADIDQSTANGNLISEAGLFKVSGGMFNVKTFPAIPKTTEFSLHFEWVIKIA
jgi:hypothetical protein